MRACVYVVASASLIAGAASASAAPLSVNVDQLMNDQLALHGVTVSSATKIGKAASRSDLEDNVLFEGAKSSRLSAVFLRQAARRGSRDFSIAGGRSYRAAKRLRLDLTMKNTVSAGPLGSDLVDHSADAMVLGRVGSSTALWAGVTQHMRMGGTSETRRDLKELYGGVVHNLSDLTSLRLDYYRAESETLSLRPTTSVSVSLDHILPHLGSVGVTALQSKDAYSDDKRASLSVNVHKLPF